MEEKVTDNELKEQTMSLASQGAHKLYRKHEKMREIIQDYTIKCQSVIQSKSAMEVQKRKNDKRSIKLQVEGVLVRKGLMREVDLKG